MKRSVAKVGLNTALNIVKIAVAAGIIYWLVNSGRLDMELVKKSFSPETLIAGVFLLGCNVMINNFRWLVLLRAQNFALSFLDSLRLTMVGLFFNLVMPGGVGGDLVKGFYLCRDHKERRTEAAVTILMDRIVGFFGMVVLSVLAVIANWDEVFEKPALYPLVVGILGLFFAFNFIFAVGLSSRSQRFLAALFARMPGGKILLKLHSAFYAYRATKWRLFGGLLMSLVSQSFAVYFFVVIGRAIGFSAPTEAYFFVVPLAMIAMAAPLAPAGIGVGQAAAFFLFNLILGSDSDLGPTAMTSFQLVSIGLSLVGGVLYFTMRRNSTLPTDEELEGSVS